MSESEFSDGQQTAFSPNDYFVTTVYFDIVGILYLAIASFLYYSGFWFDITVMTEKCQIPGELRIAYKYGQGKAKARKLHNQLSKICSAAKIIHIYYDHPLFSYPGDVRWAIGYIVDIDGKPAIPYRIETDVYFDGFKDMRIPEINRAVVTEFPNTTFLSRVLQNFRVYKYIENFEKEFSLNGCPHIEIYDEKLIYYCRPLEDPERFTVDEILKEEVSRILN